MALEAAENVVGVHGYMMIQSGLVVAFLARPLFDGPTVAIVADQQTNWLKIVDVALATIVLIQLVCLGNRPRLIDRLITLDRFADQEDGWHDRTNPAQPSSPGEDSVALSRDVEVTSLGDFLMDALLVHDLPSRATT